MADGSSKQRIIDSIKDVTNILVTVSTNLLCGRGFALLLQGIASERDYYCTRHKLKHSKYCNSTHADYCKYNHNRQGSQQVLTIRHAS